MTRPRVITIALFAVIATGVLAAPAAQAAETEVEGGAALVKGEQLEGSHTFTLTDNGNLATKCTTLSASGSVENGASIIEVHPTMSGCTAFGLGATITTTGCNLVVHVGTSTGAEGFDGTADLACETGKAIVVSAGTCEVKVDAQTGLPGGRATNSGKSGKEMDILVHINISKISYTVTKDGFLCPLSGTGGSEGDITGTCTIRAYSKEPFEPANQVGITLK